MNIQTCNFYFFSTEMALPGAPIACSFVREFVVGTREMAIVRCGGLSHKYGKDTFIIAPKHVGSSFFSEDGDDPVFVHLIEAPMDIADQQPDDLVVDRKYKVLDWGGVTCDFSKAQTWQVR